LLGELLVLGVADEGGLHSGNLLGWDVPGVIFAVLPALQFV
jgi:hypothetical protein